MIEKEHDLILSDLMESTDYQKVYYALRKTAIPADYDGRIYGKSQLQVDKIPLPFEKIIHHQNGDVSVIIKDMGALRFIDRVRREKHALEKLRIIHDW